MNTERLKQLRNLIIQVPNDLFDMSYFRKAWDVSRLHECKTVGCLLGHSTVLDLPENVDKFRNENGFIDFKKWGESFYEMEIGTNAWDFIFNGFWSWTPQTKNKYHAIYRIQKILDGYKPNLFKMELELEKQKFIK